jgi:DNA replication protein DnaC
MKYKDATTLNLSEEVRRTISSAINENKSLFIYGNTGVGKSYTLYALAKGRGSVENFVSLLVEFRDSMQKGFYYEKLKEFLDEKYLFIDDIGAEKTSDFVIEFLYQLVNKRYENMKRTVLVTNLTLEEFAQRYGDRILSRIQEMCVLLEIKGEDKRI